MKKEIQMKMYDSFSAEMTEMTGKLVEEFIGSAGDGVWLQAVSMLSGLSKEDLQAVAQKEKSISVNEMTAFLTGILNVDDSCEELKADNIAGTEDYMHVVGTASAFLRDWTEGIRRIIAYTPAFSDSVLQSANVIDDEKMLEKYHLFMDAGSLCEEGMSEFIDKIIGISHTSENVKRVIVPKAVVKTIMKLAENSKERQLMGACDGMRNLQKLQKAGLLSIRGDEGDVTVLSTFVSALSRFKPVNNMILLTYDNALADLVDMLNRSGIEGDDILVAYVNSDGIAEGWSEETARSLQSTDIELIPEKSDEESDNELYKTTWDEPANEPKNENSEAFEDKMTSESTEEAGSELINDIDGDLVWDEMEPGDKTEWVTEEADEDNIEDAEDLLDGFESSSWNITD